MSAALRARILAAATRFANELADAIESDAGVANDATEKPARARPAITDLDRARARKKLRKGFEDR